ncbi:MAG: [acyl-carrier-protein] S-malonyltransferase [Planctomycetota bacterium]|jgi:[acyl-carrier-protein] S-malonyltransferase
MEQAFLFPGQGAQYSGMGKDWYDAFPVAKETFEEANQVLGFSLTDAIWAEGDGVNRTDIAQPGILATSAAIVAVLRDKGFNTAQASFTAGLSLGEYTALWFAGSLKFADAIRLVRLRGEAMQAAAELSESSMLALTGGNEEQAVKLAAIGSEHGICAVANLNAPGQVILSGEIAALDAAAAAAKDVGVRRTRRLVVAGGFHSECMAPAQARLETALAEVEISAPQIPFATNVTAGLVTDPSEIRSFLAKQVCSPVRWEQSMRGALERGVRSFIEPGPGKVLTGLMGRIDSEAEVRSIAVPGDLEAS